MALGQKLPDRIEDKIFYCPTSGCWLWGGAVNHGGYGIIWDGSRTVRAHRFVFEFYKNQIPDSLQLDHLCRNRSCVNPDHLEPVTQAENMRRGNGPTGTNSRKTHCPNGHPYNGTNTKKSGGSRKCRICSNTLVMRIYYRNKDRSRTVSVENQGSSGAHTEGVL